MVHSWEMHSPHEIYVAAANGHVVKTRSAVRVIAAHRWSAKAIQEIRGTPDCFQPEQSHEDDAHVEALPLPHDHPADENPDGKMMDKPTLPQPLKKSHIGYVSCDLI